MKFLATKTKISVANLTPEKNWWLPKTISMSRLAPKFLSCGALLKSSMLKNMASDVEQELEGYPLDWEADVCGIPSPSSSSSFGVSLPFSNIRHQTSYNWLAWHRSFLSPIHPDITLLLLAWYRVTVICPKQRLSSCLQYPGIIFPTLRSWGNTSTPKFITGGTEKRC